MISDDIAELIGALEKGDTRAWDNVNQITFYLKEFLSARRKIDLLVKDAHLLAEALEFSNVLAGIKSSGALDNHQRVMKEVE